MKTEKLLTWILCSLLCGELYCQTVTIDLNTEYQSISGFGGINMPGWINDLTVDQTYKAFGNDPGQLGLTILRVRVPNDTTQFYREVPTALIAKDLGALVFASPWSPPAVMKSNSALVDGYLLPEFYDDFAEHLLSFATYMYENGAPLHAVSLQNEPDVQVNYESCDWTSQQMINFLKEEGSKFDSLKIIVAESFHFDKAMTDPILNDTAAEKYVGIIGGHIYGGGLSDYPLARTKNKEVWMTEHYTESQNSANAWPLALDVATEMSNCMKANYNAYVWWYLRRFYGPIDDAGNITKRGYIMSQFSKFIRPGSVRVDAAVNLAPNITATAYKTDSSFTLVVVNRGSSDIDLDFTIQNGSPDTLTKFTTSASKNILNDGTFAVNSGTFSSTIDASSIITFTSHAENGGKFQNLFPFASAGSDSVMSDLDNSGYEHILLDGSLSFDLDGTIANYSWSEDGIQIAWGPVFEYDAATGDHVYVLTVADNDGDRNYDTVNISIQSLFNTELWLEAECGSAGSNWLINPDAAASNSKFVIVNELESIANASADTADLLLFDIHIPEPGIFKLWGRVITPTANDDSFWIRMDDGGWAMWNSITAGTTWHWDDVHDQNNENMVVEYTLDTGHHQLSVCYRENGCALDKFYLTNTGSTPDGIGEKDTTCMEEDTTTIGLINKNEIANIHVFPNPSHSGITINWEETFDAYEILNITGECLIHGKTEIPVRELNLSVNLRPGIYILRVNNKLNSGIRKIIIE